MLDSNIFDRIAADPVAVETVCGATSKGRIQLLATHIQQDELKATPDDEKRADLLRLLRDLSIEPVPTHGAVYGISKYGMATYTRAGNRLEELRVGGRKPNAIRDALIAATAAVRADVLITEDRRLAGRIKRILPHLQVWTLDELIRHLDSA